MFDSNPRASTSDAAGQRKARRAQPYPSNSTALYPPARDSAPHRGSFESVTSAADSSANGGSSRASPDSPDSSQGDTRHGSNSQGPILQRGSACLTCRRRKLKCDASKPACTSCIRSGRSQTCSYDDGLPKSRVQLLSGKVRDLEAKIKAMEMARQSSGGTQLQPHPTLSSTNVLLGTPGENAADIALLSRSYPTQASDIWMPPVPGPNELVNLAASLAVPVSTSAPLSLQRNEVVDTIRRMTPWWELDEIPSGIQQYLINIFLARRWEPATEIDVPRLWASLSQTADKQPHKCFLYAMYLVACPFTGDKTFEDLQPIFVTRVRKEMEIALTQGDRLVDFIRASSLLSFHYCSTRWQPQSEFGRIDTVEDEIPTTSRNVPRLFGGRDMIPRPRDNIEKNEYIHAFWTVYMQDMGGKSRIFHVAEHAVIGLAGALVTGLPSSVADSEITTPWPVPVNEVIPLDRQSEQPTLVALYSGIPGCADLSHDRHTQALRIKSMCLLSRAAKLANALESARFPDSALWFKHSACEKAIIEASQTFPTELERLGFEGSVTLAARATLFAAQIQLHAFLANRNLESRKKCLAAANDSMKLLRKLRYMTVPEGLLLLFGSIHSQLDWVIVKDFFSAERTRLLEEGNIIAAESMANNVQEITAEMNSVPAKYTTITP
ncbi:Fungal specific transcription factor domain containing protein [Ceratobasidium theobromae]|uniref:Fungal specific transcription factor domain containing protein n=1 Tax=Ceratobasidium theobromae TaxID=1582974 RepID=A0A5N5QU79_9AGAM|nr:Fungal specific transcription factor domain containing protein [Ceratobasidium theobromae]